MQQGRLHQFNDKTGRLLVSYLCWHIAQEHASLTTDIDRLKIRSSQHKNLTRTKNAMSVEDKK